MPAKAFFDNSLYTVFRRNSECKLRNVGNKEVLPTARGSQPGEADQAGLEIVLELNASILNVRKHHPRLRLEAWSKTSERRRHSISRRYCLSARRRHLSGEGSLATHVHRATCRCC